MKKNSPTPSFNSIFVLYTYNSFAGLRGSTYPIKRREEEEKEEKEDPSRSLWSEAPVAWRTIGRRVSVHLYTCLAVTGCLPVCLFTCLPVSTISQETGL